MTSRLNRAVCWLWNDLNVWTGRIVSPVFISAVINTICVFILETWTQNSRNQIIYSQTAVLDPLVSVYSCVLRLDVVLLLSEPEVHFYCLLKWIYLFIFPTRRAQIRGDRNATPEQQRAGEPAGLSKHQRCGERTRGAGRRRRGCGGHGRHQVWPRPLWRALGLSRVWIRVWDGRIHQVRKGWIAWSIWRWVDPSKDGWWMNTLSSPCVQRNSKEFSSQFIVYLKKIATHK